MFDFQSLDGLQNVSDLIRLGFSTLALLDVDARVARPRHLEYAVTASVLTRLAEIMLTDLLGIGESHVSGARPRCGQDFLHGCHE
jgi:hypothetical protein